MSWDALEEAIAARLEARLGPLVKKVYTASELADVEEDSQITPSVAVIFNGIAPVSAAGGQAATQLGKVQLVEKSWLITVAVRNALNTRTRKGAREASAPIVSAVLSALLGWRPTSNSPDPTIQDELKQEGPLQLAPTPGAAFTDAGFAYYPIAFTNRRTYRGTD
jgi:hypothetical protein